MATLALPAFALDDVEDVQVRVVNADAETASALQGSLELASVTRRAIRDEVTATEDLLGAALAEYRAMISVLYGRGYYGPDISVTADGREVADISPFNQPRSIDTVVITVDPGPQFRFGRTDVGPREPQAAATGAPLVPGFARGEPARSGLIGGAANAAVSEWRNEGHAKANVGAQDITADHRRSRLDVEIGIEPGPRLRFGEVIYAGRSKVREKRIREMLGLPTGEQFSPEELNDAANRLRRSGTFRTVVLTEADAPNPDGTLDYTLSVIDQLPRRFGFGAEYSTLDGIALSGFWLHRNLFGGAERLRIDGQIANIGGTEGSGYSSEDDDLSGVDYSLGLRMTRPAYFGPDNDAFLFLGATREDEPDYLETAGFGGIGLTRYFSDELYGEVAGGYRFSHVEDAFGERDFNHLYLPSRLEWDMRNDQGDPTGGFYFDARVTPAVGVDGSSDFIYFDLDNRAYVSFADDAVTLAGRVQVGSVPSERLRDVPPDFLFFSGGGDTVRGQTYQSLGSGEFRGDQVGGRSFLGLSAEIRTRIGDAFGVVAFADFGYVGADAWIDGDARDHSGIGLGVRYATPIGPIRVDIATPFTGPDTDGFDRVELYIGVGQAF